MQRAEQVRLLRQEGLLQRQIAAKLGISRTYVGDLINDPTGERVKTRKDSYRGTCKDCGARTSGSNGPAKAPEYCNRHASRAHFLYWSESKIIAAIKEWHFIHGKPPVATDWNRQVEGSPGQYIKRSRSSWVGFRRWPPLHAVQDRFGSWANAVEAAGFPRPKIGHWRNESKRSEILTKWTPEVILEWIREHADGGRPPSCQSKGAPANAAIRKFGSWNNAVIAAGYKPNRIVRSTG